ncbi:JAB domain-containing protein [Pedobacter sp. GR22-6]|uniref:JAB domain-containing protein n=1 Tax=Pedobacter sp. GR22-6 TaxID=3127957 RepID=UPI00307DF872
MTYARYHFNSPCVAEDSGSRDNYNYLNFEQLSNRELLAIVISADDDCEDGNLNQADLILNHVEGNLNRLAWLSLQELLNIEGVRYSKVLALAAANTLLHKRTENKLIKLHQADDSRFSFNIIKSELKEAEKGSFWLFLFDGQGKLQHKHHMGDTKNSFYDHRKILQIALEQKSCSLLLVNHSKWISSRADKASRTNILALIEAANTLSMVVLDYIVTHAQGYCSYRDNGWFEPDR